jgi:polysaccharide chain length determinant protein (PEP-CTERM system associated)
MGDENRGSSPFEQILAVWRRRKWLAILVFVVPLTAAVSLVTFLPNIYQSTATVLVDRQQVPEEFVRSTVTSALETRLHTISQEILSRSRLERLISQFGLYPDLRRRVSPEEVIERMRKDIQLELRGAEAATRDRRATIAFAVSYRGSNAQTVAQVTNTLASFYIEENLKVRERQATGTAEFLRVQLDQVKEQLDRQEKQVSEFKKRHVGELPQELEVNLATLERLNGQLRLNGDSRTRLLERRDAYMRQMTETGWVTTGGSTAGPAPPDPTAMRLAKLRQELTELLTRFNEKYPDVVRLKAEIALLEKESSKPRAESREVASGPTVVDPQLLRMRQALGEIEAELKVLNAEEGRLRAAVGTYQERVRNTPRREQEYKELARDYESTKELYASLLKRYAESQIAESMEQRQKGEQFRILDPAIAADKPAAPNRLQLVLVGLAISIGLSVGAVLVAEQRHSAFHSADELRAFTTVPVLARIPRIVTPGDTARRRRRVRLAALSVVTGLVLVVGLSYLVANGNEQLVWLLAPRRF